ncbi:unnamed protein product [Cyclocybe aegerita]|uniref:Uncharacterized protein n=1 Tax=Cyclocybe aegerita TaxID=1973307 RepID=A0A8S0WN24_CYCAE|nr:unnamed protein product [Cyclocybe aegerita]
MRDWLGSLQDFSSSGLTIDDLPKLNILEAGLLKLKSDAVLAEQVQKTKVVGQDDIWSSINLYRHLERLQTLIGRPKNEAAARAWTDAFLFRVSAMVLQNETMVLSMKQSIPPTAMKSPSSTTLHGVVEYTAEAADRSVDEIFLSDPAIERMKLAMPSGLVVTVAKSFSMSLQDHIPQAVCKMKPVVCGVLTVGDTWIFLVVVMNSNSDGAKYWQSEEISILTLTPPGHARITSPWPDVVAGILADWMKQRFEDIEGGDDWFEVGL